VGVGGILFGDCLEDWGRIGSMLYRVGRGRIGWRSWVRNRDWLEVCHRVRRGEVIGSKEGLVRIRESGGKVDWLEAIGVRKR
jgi:hypothetical protein